MYKDKDKQKEAVKQATRRYRANKQGITPIVSQERGITVIPGEGVEFDSAEELIADLHEPEPQSHNPNNASTQA